MSIPYKKLSKEDAVLLLIDHQAGLISLVQDFSPDDFKNNVLALGDVGKFFNIPTILTTSFDQGPNGPIVPELKEQLRGWYDGPRKLVLLFYLCRSTGHQV